MFFQGGQLIFVDQESGVLIRIFMHEVFNSMRKWKGARSAVVSIAVSMIFSLVIGPANLFAASPPSEPEFNHDILVAVAVLYGISEDKAVERLARESEAAITLKLLQSLPIKSYAGSWFDESSLQLKVAIADPDDLLYLKMLNVEPANVNNSLMVLQDKLIKAINQLSLVQELNLSVITSYIDLRSNVVVLTVNTPYAGSVRSELDRAEFSGLIKIEEMEKYPLLSTGPVRAANGTRNLTWAQDFGGVWPCSIGASVEDGYVTAGHCGSTNNNMGDAAGNSLGVVQGSTWFNSNPSTDSAHVQTITGWNPGPEVNGYSDGIFSVSAEWAGMVEFPVGSTVCRYGQTSGGPHCGTVNQLNVTVNFGGHTVTGLTQLAGSCSDAGDSGGPHVAGTGQIQGTNTGTQKFNINDTCPTPAQYVWFQPIKDSLDEFGVTMLTTHGNTAPKINFVLCPDRGSSGSKHYECLAKNIDSQGEVQLQWSSNTGDSSTNPWLFGTCAASATVSVTLQASNPYGTSSKQFSFGCPTQPLP